MRTLAVVGGRSNETNVSLVAAWRALGLPAVLLPASEARERLAAGDVALGRLDVLATLDGAEPGLVHLLDLEHRGVRVLNRARSLVRVHDKLWTARALDAAGLPHPRTGVVRRPSDPLPVPAPLVLKPRLGSWGRDVFRCATDADARETLRRVSGRPWFRRHGVLVQELLPSAGRDLRLVVACGEVVGAAVREAPPGEWRTNVSLGATKRPATPPPDACRLGIAAAESAGADLVGVDLLPLPDGGHAVLELNGAVDFDQDYGRDVFLRAATVLGLLPHGARGCDMRPRDGDPSGADVLAGRGSPHLPRTR